MLVVWDLFDVIAIQELRETGRRFVHLGLRARPEVDICGSSRIVNDKRFMHIF